LSLEKISTLFKLVNSEDGLPYIISSQHFTKPTPPKNRAPKKISNPATPKLINK